MSDENDIKLRDQLAIAAMQALLGNYKQFTYTSESSNNYPESSNKYSTSNEYPLEIDKDYIARIESKIEMISDLSYKITDAMRKARLKSFT
jgi:hypothetical protein